MQGETLFFVECGDPAPGACADEVRPAVDGGAQPGEGQRDEPGAEHESEEDAVVETAADDGGVEGVGGDEEDEKTRGDVAYVEEPALGEAGGAGGEDGVCADPVEGEDEGEGLLEVGD